LEHPRQQPNEYRWAGHKPRCENYRVMVTAGRNRGDGVI